MTANQITEEPGGRENGQIEMEAEDTHSKFLVAEEASFSFLLNCIGLASLLSFSVTTPTKTAPPQHVCQSIETHCSN